MYVLVQGGRCDNPGMAAPALRGCHLSSDGVVAGCECQEGGDVHLKPAPSPWTHEMIEALAFNFLDFLPPNFLYAAFVAWLGAFYGFAFDLLRRWQNAHVDYAQNAAQS